MRQNIKSALRNGNSDKGDKQKYSSRLYMRKGEVSSEEV